VSPAAGDTWRLFVALPVPDHVRVLAQAAAAPAKDAHPELSWTRPAGWHVTLAYLGDVAVDRVPAIERSVGEVVGGAGGPIACHLGAAGSCGRRALWLEVVDDPRGAVASLGAAVQSTLVAASLPVQPQEVRPHLTLARASKRGADARDAVGEVASVTAAWEADEVALVRSHLGDGPARYEAIATFPFGPPR
jgi:RNA 2',3'-cyclic 3'-phosphodiesterase